MTPKTYFHDVWVRCDLFSSLHSFVSNHASSALQPDELLRAEWAARVSALDLYVHELVSQNLLLIFEGSRPSCPGFARFHISNDTLMRIQSATSPTDRSKAFDLEVRTKLSRITYQYPDDIADGIRLISPQKIWHEVAMKLGATAASVTSKAEDVKTRLSLIVDRRNKIVHEGDLQPSVPRVPWPISKSDVAGVAKFIEEIVIAIDGTI